MFDITHSPALVTALTVALAAPVSLAQGLPAATPMLSVASAGASVDAASGAASGAAFAAPSASRLEDVVVTGDKLRRAETATTQSISTRSGRQIDESSATRLEDVVGGMANIGTTYGLTIRGISLYGPTGGEGKTATITVDGIPQDGAGQSITGLSVWDAAGVEVLRGPQSTNQGRNALAGAVVLKTRNPTDFWDLRGRASVNDPRGYNLAVAGGGPLIGDVLAFRLSAEDQRDDGDSYNRTRDDKRWNRDDRKTVRGKLRFTPDGTDYQALLTVAQDRRAIGDAWVEATRLPGKDRIALANEPSLAHNRSSTAALEQTLSGFGIDWTLLSIWGRHRYDRVSDYDYSELNQGTSAALRSDDQQSHELRGNFEHALGPGRLKGVFGAYWARETADDLRDYIVPVSYVLTAFGVCPNAATCERLYPTDAVLRRDVSRPVIRNKALFAEFDYQVGSLTFTAGLRQDHESQARVIDSTTSGDTPTARRIVALLVANGIAAPDGAKDLSTTYSALLPKLGVSYRLDPRWIAGLSVQRGYRTGGVNYSYQRGPNAFDPEFTNNYDVSLKGMLGEGLLLTLNAYRIDWRDQQVNVGANSLDAFVINAGRSRLQGMEAELRGKVANQLELFGALGLSRTRFVDFVSPAGDFSGNEFAYSPRQTASLGATWKPGAFALNAQALYEGKTFSDSANGAGRANASHTVLNSKLSYAFTPKLRAFVAGQNLTDKVYTTYRLDNVANRQVVQLGRGRTLWAGLEAEL